MALIAKFEERPLEPKRLHGPVVCGFRAVEVEGHRVLQLETYGSPERKMPDKISQSIQIDRTGALQLQKILTDAFPGL